MLKVYAIFGGGFWKKRWGVTNPITLEIQKYRGGFRYNIITPTSLLKPSYGES